VKAAHAAPKEYPMIACKGPTEPATVEIARQYSNKLDVVFFNELFVEECAGASYTTTLNPDFARNRPKIDI